MTENQLIDAAMKGDTAKVTTLLDRGVNIHCTDWNGCTPLHMAAGYGREDTTRLLLQRGAKVDMKTKFGSTPLHSASYNGKMECVRLLLDHKANVNSVDNNGETPLYDACEQGEGDVARLLLSHGGTLGDKNISKRWSVQIKKLLTPETKVTLEDFNFTLDPASLVSQQRPLTLGSTRLDNKGAGSMSGMIGVERSFTTTHSLSLDESTKTLTSLTKGKDRNINAKFSIPYIKGLELGGGGGKNMSVQRGKEVELTSSKGFEVSTSSTVTREITVTSAPHCDMQFDAVILECNVNVPFRCSAVTRLASTGAEVSRTTMRGHYKGLQHSQMEIRSKVLQQYPVPGEGGGGGGRSVGVGGSGNSSGGRAGGSSSGSVRGTPPSTPHDEWGPDDVCQWLSSMRLSTDYSEAVQLNHITGSVVKELSADEWKEVVGVSVFGDRKLIASRAKLL